MFSFLINSIANWDPLSDIMLFSNLYNYYILSLNNCINPSTDISSVIATKYVILDNLLYITKIAFFLVTNSNLVIKSTIRYVQSFFSILVSAFLLVLLSYSLFFSTYYILLYIFLHLFSLLATSSFLSSILLSSTFLYILLPVHYDVNRLFLPSTSHLSAHKSFSPSVSNSFQSTIHLLIILLFLLSLSLLLL